MYDTIMTPPFEDMRQTYFDNYSLRFIATDIKEKFAMISLIGYLVKELRKTKPDITYYSLVKKIRPDLPEDYAKAIAIVCEDFAYGCTDFITFGIPPKDMAKTIKEILGKCLPF